MNRIGMKIDEVRVDGCMEKFIADLDAIQDMGIKAVELPVHGLDVILNGRINQNRLEQVIEILKPYQFSCSVHSPNPINLMDKTDPDLHADVLVASLEFARAVGAKAVVLHSGRFFPEENFNLGQARDFTQKEKLRMLEQEARYLQKIAVQYPDVTITLENARPYSSQSPYCYAETLDPLKTQVERVAMENVRINLDIGHLYMSASFYSFDPVAEVRKIKGLIAHTHIHDNFGGVVHHWEKQQTHQLPFGRGDSHMPVGWGCLPVREILDVILPDFHGLLMMELRSRYFKNIPESAKNLSNILTMLTPDRVPLPTETPLSTNIRCG